MFKKCKVVMLPTNEKANALWWSGHKLYVKGPEDPSRGELNHLYFLSDEEIKEGDWVYCLREGFEPVLKQKVNPIGVNNDKMFKKIIATTDTSLGNPYSGDKDAEKSSLYELYSLPQPSQSFIEKFVEEYNKGNVITEVMVEYEEILGDEGIIAFALGQTDKRLKVNPKDNTITIRKVKDSWNREEMLNLLESAWNGGALYGSSKSNSHYFDKLIEENL